MCGIAGFLGGPVDDRTAVRVLSRIAHRGPDGEGIFRDGPVCLLHRRLSIIDVSVRARQPMIDPETGVAIVFNGEIYNYRQLKQQHGGNDYRTQSDTEVILRLYIERGIACVEELRGMFAIAVWDPRSRDLHLVRDRFGIKPLYWRHDGEGLAFGSEIKAILAFGKEAKLNRDIAYDYLAHGLLAHSPETLFEGINALPPGSLLTCRAGGEPRISTYWSAVDQIAPVGASADPADAEAEIWSLFREVLDLHMVSDVPVGVTLSSGLDSTFLLHVLAANGEREIDAFTYGFTDADYDEVRRIDFTSLPVSVRHHTVQMRPEDTIDDLAKAIEVFETPIGGLGTLGLYKVFNVARQRNIKVVLAGEGSDETFGGYRYYGYSRLRDLYERRDPGLEAESAAFGRLQGEILQVGSVAFRDKVENADTQVWAPDGTPLAGEAFLGPALDECCSEDSWRRSSNWTKPVTGGISHFRRALIRDICVQKIPKLLWFQDRASMASGVESRVPFLDHKLHEFVGKLDDRWLLNGGISKFILKRLYGRFCKIDLSRIRKHFVSTPQREWIRGPLAHRVEDIVGGGHLARLGLIDRDAFLKGYAKYRSEGALGNSFFVWKVLNLELLVEKFFRAGIQTGGDHILRRTNA